MPALAHPTAWAFLDGLYGVPGIKSSFDAVAIHPYSATIEQFHSEIEHMRAVMRRHYDSATPLWLTELGWGSAHPSTRWPVNQGWAGQAQMLSQSFRLILRKRREWRIRRVFWFDWRDPPIGQGHYCSFCGSAGLLRNDHRPKPAYRAYRRFARETAPRGDR